MESVWEGRPCCMRQLRTSVLQHTLIELLLGDLLLKSTTKTVAQKHKEVAQKQASCGQLIVFLILPLDRGSFVS